MKQDPYKIEMSDVAKEVNADVVITYHTATFRLTNEQLQSMKAGGFQTDVMSCIMAGLVLSGKTEEEVRAFFNEATAAEGKLSVSFEAPDGEELAIWSKEENPMLDKLVQSVE